jgi:hypothetical protein
LDADQCPGCKRFSVSNLWMMMHLYDTYGGNEKFAPLVRVVGKTLNTVERTSQAFLNPSNSRELKPNQDEQVVSK